MPSGGDRAMATFDPGEGVTAAELAAVDPRAVGLSIPRLPHAPAGARVYVSLGDVDARALAGSELPAELGTTRALLVNEREAGLLTGSTDPGTAAAALARVAPVVIVTLGAEGALAAGADGTVHVPGVAVEAVDTTGAGDLFAAGFLFGLVRNAGHENAGRLGGLAAAEVIQHLGARPEVSLKDLARQNGLPL
jgi:sugar/nucleoside kinase (ribokinase family)